MYACKTRSAISANGVEGRLAKKSSLNRGKERGIQSPPSSARPCIAASKKFVVKDGFLTLYKSMKNKEKVQKVETSQNFKKRRGKRLFYIEKSSL
jgi:hypothetical protein